MEYNEPIPNKDYKVLVKCFTFNQSKYIEDALNGFTMQKTTFPFVCLVMDDCSTDGEQKAIKTWMERECDMARAEQIDLELSDVILVPHKTNSNCTFAFYLLKQNLYGIGKKPSLVAPWREQCKYEAICEGDDYWTHPQKLQMQVEFLDSHPDYSMCFHDAMCHWEDGSNPDTSFSNIQDKDYSGQDILDNWIVPTASVVYRLEVLGSDIFRMALKNANIFFGDIRLFLSCSHYGKVRGFSASMSVYRRNASGMLLSNHTYKGRKRLSKQCIALYKTFGNQYKLLMEKKAVTHLCHAFIEYDKCDNVTLHWDSLFESFRISVRYTISSLLMVIRIFIAKKRHKTS